MKKTYLNLDFVLALTFAGMNVGQLDEHADGLFTAYKHLLVKESVEGLTRDERLVKEALASTAIACAKEANRLTGTHRLRTDLPTLAEAYARECDGNQPVDAELAEMVNGAATTSQTQAEAEGEKKNATPEAPAPADSEGAAKKTRKGRLEDSVVEEIRGLLNETDPAKKMKQGEIAKKYGIDASTVSDIKVGRGRYGKTGGEATAVTKENTNDVPASTQTPAGVNETETQNAPAAPSADGEVAGF